MVTDGPASTCWNEGFVKNIPESDKRVWVCLLSPDAYDTHLAHLETEEEKALAVAADFLDSWGQGSLSNLEGYHFNDVGKDPFIMGGYTSPGIGSWPTHNPQHSANTKIAQPIGTALYFAGEGTNTSGASGLVSGAIETGERAALEVDADHSPGDGRGADAVCELKVKSGAAESLHVETFSTDDGLRLALDDFVW